MIGQAAADQPIKMQSEHVTTPDTLPYATDLKIQIVWTPSNLQTPLP